MNLKDIEKYYNDILNNYLNDSYINDKESLIILGECLGVNIPNCVYNNFNHYDGGNLNAYGAFKTIFKTLDKLQNKAQLYLYTQKHGNPEQKEKQRKETARNYANAEYKSACIYRQYINSKASRDNFQRCENMKKSLSNL